MLGFCTCDGLKFNLVQLLMHVKIFNFVESFFSLIFITCKIKHCIKALTPKKSPFVVVRLLTLQTCSNSLFIWTTFQKPISRFSPFDGSYGSRGRIIICNFITPSVLLFNVTFTWHRLTISMAKRAKIRGKRLIFNPSSCWLC